MSARDGNDSKTSGGSITLSAGQAARFSHDFRSALNIVTGFTQLLLDETPGKLNEEQRRSLNDILNSSRRINDLVNEVFGGKSTR